MTDKVKAGLRGSAKIIPMKRGPKLDPKRHEEYRQQYMRFIEEESAKRDGRNVHQLEVRRPPQRASS